MLIPTVQAQLPSTDIYLFDIEETGKRVVLNNPKCLTDFNSAYNNQAVFFNDNEIYFTSNWEDEEQTDIYKFTLDEKELLRVTDTPQSEYSPKQMPEGTNLSVIRVELDKNASQVLWQYPIALSNTGNAVLLYKDKIGYYEWLNLSKLALFVLGEKNKLILYDNITGKYKPVANNIGRCMKHYDGKVFFVQKSVNTSYINEYNPVTKRIRIICTTVDNKEDFDVTDEGVLWTSSGDNIYRRKILGNANWIKVAKTSEWNLSNLNRIQVLNNKLLIINNNE